MPELQTLPETFEQLRQAVPTGYSISERLLEPFILVSRKGNQIVAQIGGIRTVRGERHEFLAPSNRHMWIVDGTIIRPLPRDATQAMFEKIGDLDIVVVCKKLTKKIFFNILKRVKNKRISANEPTI